MHPEFADWYRGSNLTPPDGLIEQRWNAVEALAHSESEEVLLGLLRLYTLPNATEAECPPVIRDAFRERDPAFPASGNLQEMRVLAGAVLRQMFNSGAPAATAAALGILAALNPGRIPPIPKAPHVDAADAYCTRTATERRKRTTGSRFELVGMSEERFMPIFQPAATTNTVAALAGPLRNLLTEILSSANSALAQAVSSLESDLRKKDEELDYLWWLTAAHSRDLDLPFKTVGALAGALVYPAELAALTAYLPGPASAVAILFQALALSGAQALSDDVSLQDVVNSAPRTWRERQTKQTRFADLGPLCPVMLAVTTSLVTDGPADWLPVYRKACDLPPDLSIGLALLATQAYRERLFERSIRDFSR